ncbi:Intersectin-1 [Blattella germanica]|nr:Intersectin-1 [Blattella germanica]
MHFALIQSGDKSPSTPEIAAMTGGIQLEDIGEDSDSKVKGKKPEIATVIAPYQATSAEQLDLQRGQLIMIRKKTSTGWWEGELQARGKKRQIGWFPASYVKLLGSGGSNQKVVALFQYTALNEDELSFEKDDVITLLAREEAAWWRGELNGVSGLFPSNYVAPLSKFLQQLTEASADFRNIVKQCQADPRIRGMPLSSFLIKPMQRITKYPLLIKKILDYTPSNHPDRQNLQEALSKAEEFCTQVNEGVREKENSERLEWLQRCVQCEGLEEELIFNSMTNSLGPRKFLHFGVLHKAKSGKELVGFLMNDFLLLAQPPKPIGNNFSFEKYANATFKLYKKPLFLNELAVPRDNGQQKSTSTPSESSGNDSPEMSTLLRLQDVKNKNSFNMLAPSAKERNLWIKCLDQACNEILVVVMEGVGLKPRSASEFLGRTEVRIADILQATQNSTGPIIKRLSLRLVKTGEIVLKLDLRLFNKDT